jgi:integrase
MKVIFTDKFIQTAKIPLTGRVEHYDQRAKGLCLRITPNGKRTFSFIYREEGDKTQHRKTLGEYPYLSLADARKSAIAMQNRLHQGLAVVEKKQVVTFEEVANLYWEKELKHIKTCDEEWRRLTKDAIPAWRKKAISAITVQDVSKLLSNVRERVHSTQQPRSSTASQHGVPAANRLQTRLSRLFRFACEQGLCEDEPTERIVRKKEGSRDRVLTAKEIKQFWQLCTQSLIDEKTKTALKLILLLGQRPGEICCMRWEDIEWEQATWLNITSKTGEKNTVPLSPTAIVLLEPSYFL